MCFTRQMLYLKKYNSSRRDGYFKEKLAGITGYSRYEVIKAIMDLLEKMEPLNHQWPEYRDELKVCLLGDGEAAYEEMRKAFFQRPEAEKMNLWTEQLMVYFVYTYFCGGVYNENPYGKMKSRHRIHHYDPGYDDGPLEKTWYTDFKRGSRCSPPLFP